VSRQPRDRMNIGAGAGTLAECSLAGGDLDRAHAVIAETMQAARDR
jgi:hypothetical protein